MKKCPTCGKTFDDNLRFCQVDGTPLVDEQPAAAAPPQEDAPFDPYATIVGVPKSAVPPSTPAEAPVEPSAPQSGGSMTLEPVADEAVDTARTASSIPVAPPDDILDLGVDPLKTMYVSDVEMKEVLGTASQGSETPAEEIRADEAQAEIGFPPPPPSPFDSSPPPSPFSESSDPDQVPVPAPPSFLGSDQGGFDEAATVIQPNVSGPSEPPQSQPQEWAPPPPPQQMQQQEWAPPPAPTPEWQDQQIGSNTPFQPPPVGAGSGQNKTLAVVSLVCGILSLVCCSWFVVGLAAIITGFIARKNVKTDPGQYTGEGMALAGIICGAISMVIGIVVWVLYGGMILSSGGFR